MTASPQKASAAARPLPQLQHDGRRFDKKQVSRHATATDASRGNRKQSTAERFSSTNELTSRAASGDSEPRNHRHCGPVWFSDWLAAAPLQTRKRINGAAADLLLLC